MAVLEVIMSSFWDYSWACDKSSGVNKENYESFENLTEAWLVRKNWIILHIGTKTGVEAKAAGALLHMMIWCVLVCLPVCVCWFSCGRAFWHACRFLQQTEEENQSFSRRHPIHDTFSCEFGVDTAAHTQLWQEGVYFFFFLLLTRVPSLWSIQTDKPSHVVTSSLWTFYRSSLQRAQNAGMHYS